MPMPCSPEITPSSAARQRHDARHRLVRGLQHLVVVAVDRDVGVHVAVAGVHVQRHPDAALAAPRWWIALALGQDRRERGAGEDRLQRRADLRLPAGAQACGPAAARNSASSAHVEARASRCHSARTSRSSASACCTRSSSSSADGISLASSLLPSGRLPRGEEGLQRVDQRELVAQRQLDVDALDAVGVLAHARQRDHHVLVDLEGVGVLADRRGALAVEPELLARLGADGDEALAAARVGDAHHLAGGARHRVGVVADDVADQHHLRQPAALATWWRSRPPCR